MTASPDKDFLGRAGPAQDGGNVVHGLADELRPKGVADGAQSLQPAREIAAKPKADAADKRAAVHFDPTAIVIKNNVFENAIHKGITVNPNVGVAEGLVVKVHGCRFLADASLDDGTAESTI